MTDDLNPDPQENPENMDFSDAEASYEDDPAVQDAMLRGFTEPPVSSIEQHFTELEDQAVEVYSTENDDQPSRADENKKSGDSIWKKFRGLLMGDADHIAERIRQLDSAIENAGDTPANYVLRGELYLRLHEYALARRDFQRAQELAAVQFEQSDWGLMAQAMEDRALLGLQKADKKLQAAG
jgi:hypothetical protein